MPRIKLEFPNQHGHRLAGLLETPPPGVATRGYGLFAHCFTCGKDMAAASRISRALAARGIGVLRFDFTGLGNSDGDFANTSFSSNVADLVAAAEMLARDFAAPRLLIGHSLGGAAVLVAAHQLPQVEALVTIGSPATATHVRHLFSQVESELSTQGEAEVRIGLRRFRIKQQFLEDLEQHATPQHIGRLRRPLLLFHSPFDEVVEISEAFAIYQAAKHPKSFISLDRADHLLTHAADAVYVAETIVAWASRYLGLLPSTAEPSQGSMPAVAPGEVLACELGDSGLLGLYSDRHQLTAAAPSAHAAPSGSSELAPPPEQLLRMALAAEIAHWVRQLATTESWALDDVEVCLEPLHQPAGSSVSPSPEALRVRLHLVGALSETARQALCDRVHEAPLVAAVQSSLRLRVQLQE
ncbi:alpha/beta fold hydrolase [Rhabdochromatium marinum]|uniref:bifunctional alpha/beta hydrolase/OsmC family protein n=1 Tax=Rhabdochromatium marinum TaxID=48729 RepID=UPI0019047632|nr:alpha/beta fold hydrolase [Rhabdochromatium marinum]MBK1649376.1 osmotically inducible protein C [Rhabdochromatium marinum]